MTTYCHVGCGRLGIAIANAMMLLKSGDRHAFHEPVESMRTKAHDGEYAEMMMVAAATHSQVSFVHRLKPWKLGAVDIYIITAGIPRASPSETKEDLFDKNHAILEQLIAQIPKGAKVYIATNPPNRLAEDFLGTIPLRSCTDNLRKAVWGDGWKAANDRMLAAKGYTSYGPAVAIAKEVLGG